MYFIKGDNPLSIRLFPQLGCYLYASTNEILGQALIGLGLSKTSQADIPIRQGDIMTIDARGQRAVSRFDDSQFLPRRYFFGWGWPQPRASFQPDDYLEAVLSYAQRHGVPDRELRLLLDAGYDIFDVEQLIYDPERRERCIREVMADFGVC